MSDDVCVLAFGVAFHATRRPQPQADLRVIVRIKLKGSSRQAVGCVDKAFEI